jgi:hypothetical protein
VNSTPLQLIVWGHQITGGGGGGGGGREDEEELLVKQSDVSHNLIIGV